MFFLSFAECRVGFYKLGDKCVATCPVQYYGHVEIVLSRESHTNRTAASCHKCHTACYKCKGPRSIDCFECSSGYILKGRQCIPKQLLDFMGHSEFLIWAVLLAFLLLIVMYTVYRLRHRCLCLQEKQQQNNPTIRGKPFLACWPYQRHNNVTIREATSIIQISLFIFKTKMFYFPLSLKRWYYFWVLLEKQFWISSKLLLQIFFNKLTTVMKRLAVLN